MNTNEAPHPIHVLALAEHANAETKGGQEEPVFVHVWLLAGLAITSAKPARINLANRCMATIKVCCFKFIAKFSV